MRTVTVRTADQISLGDQTKEDEMGGACGTYGGEERHIQGFDGDTGRIETT